MTVIEVAAVGFGSFIGAILRYIISVRMNKEEGMPLGTLVVNLTGSLLIGLLIGLELPRFWTIFLASGFVGALTTFSTMIRELLVLWSGGKRKAFFLYFVYTLVFGILSAYVGFVIGQIF
jgi:fluoride exporter